jgi:hypothetical protein
MPPSPRRPHTMDELKACIKHMISAEGIRRALAFQPQPTDIFISPFAKCGTTWVQQIVHGLRTRGDMDFAEITAVVPWLEMAYELGIDVEQPQKARPRAFKSHLSWDLIPKGARYIYAIRDPRDAVVSMYHFLEGWFFEPGSIPLSVFARERFIQSPPPGRYWSHLLSWWAHRHDPDVLFLCYEDMKQDLPGTVRRIAAFIGCPLDNELMNLVVHQSSIEFMSAHKRQFDDHLIRQARDAVCGLPPGGESSKVRTGNVGDHAHELSADLIAELDQIWREEIEPQTGFPSYAALRAALPR